MKNKLAIALVIAGLIGAVYFGQFYVAGKNAVFSASGIIETTKVSVSAKTAGRLTGLKVREGDSISVGQVIAMLDRPDITAQSAGQAAAMQRAMAKLEDVSAGAREQEIKDAFWQVEQYRANVERTQNDLARLSKLYQENAIAAMELDRAQNAYQVAVSQYNAAQERYNLVVAGSRPQQITAATAEVEQAKAALTAAQALQNDLAITAPIAGTVVNKNYENGEYINMGTSVISIANLQDLWLKVYIPTEDIGRIKLGQSVKVAIDALKDRTFDGIITEVADEAEFTPKFVQTKKERANLVYGVKVKIENSEGLIKPGMPADVFF